MVLVACSALIDLQEVEYHTLPNLDGDAGGRGEPEEGGAVFESEPSTHRDGGVADASDLDDGGPSACATAPPSTRFCRHFDNDKSVTSGFTDSTVMGGTLLIDANDAFSKPRSLVANTTADQGCAYLLRTDSHDFKKVGMAFRARIGATVTGSIARVKLGSCEYGLTPKVAYTRRSSEATPQTQQSLAVEIARERWVHVRFEVSETGVFDPKLRVLVDDVVVSDVANSSGCPFLDGEATFSIGLLCGAAGREIRYDDVLFYE